jgi:hypothetical protein
MFYPALQHPVIEYDPREGHAQLTLVHHFGMALLIDDFPNARSGGAAPPAEECPC